MHRQGIIRSLWIVSVPSTGMRRRRFGQRDTLAARNDGRRLMTTVRTRLEQRAVAEHLSVREFCAAYHEAGKQLGEAVYVSDTQVKRWFRGKCGLPRGVACRVLEHWWGESVNALFGAPLQQPVTSEQDDAQLLTATAREASHHAISAAARLEGSALEQLHADVCRAARSYFTAAPRDLLHELVQLQRVVRDQFDRTRKPHQHIELYLVLGQVSGLMSSLSWALGNLDAAQRHARAAHTYGQVIDHPSLCAWTRALQVTATFWSGQPAHAVELATAALDFAPAGTARARLQSVRARALALIGSRDEAHIALQDAADELTRPRVDALLDGTGGELGFSPARQALCASTAHVVLGDPSNAERDAATALTRFATLPEVDQWPAGVVGAHIDLATARTMRGDIAGAEQALNPVFELQPSRRTAALTHRLTYLGRTLSARQLRGSAEQIRISERIAEFGKRAYATNSNAELASS